MTSERRKARKDTILRLVSIIGVSYFLLTILLLSLFTSDFSAISQAASDYGIGPFAIEMNLGFLVAGIGVITFSTMIAQRISRAGSAILFVDGAVLCMNAFFTTNPEGAPATLHGTIHGIGGGIFFFTAPVAMLLVSRRQGSRRLLITAVALVIGVSSFIASDALSLDAGGLAERIMIVVIFSWVVANAIVNRPRSKDMAPGPGHSARTSIQNRPPGS